MSHRKGLPGRSLVVVGLLACLAVLGWAVTLRAQLVPLPQDDGAVGLGLALRHLPVTGSVLYVTAHPDDENNAVLVMLNRGRGLRTALLTVTRGDGGQNEIGPELFQALGILRTEELLAVHRYDAAEQYFTRAYEFGYSFSVEETFEKWGREEILRDVVRVVRSVRPDVILTLPLEAEGGGQHHQAAARLAVEAFRAAADPGRFPEQLDEGLRTWQARKVYQGGVGGGNDAESEGGHVVVVSTSAFDPLLGMSWHELGSLARTFHKCQGASQLLARPWEGEAEEELIRLFAYALLPGRDLEFVQSLGGLRNRLRGLGLAVYSRVDSEPKVSAAESDILQDVDTSLSGLVRFVKGERFLEAGLKAVDSAARQALEAFDPRAPQKSLPPLQEGLAGLRALRDRIRAGGLAEGARYELDHRLRQKEQDFLKALALAHGLTLEATVDDGDAVPGQSFHVTARLWNQGVEPVRVEEVALRLPEGWSAQRTSGGPGVLEHDQGLEMSYRVTVGDKARYSQPYWKRNSNVDRYDIEIPEDHTLPWSPPPVMATLRYLSGSVPATLEGPAYWRYEGPWVGGEKQKVVNVVPALSVKMTPEVTIIPLASREPRREFRVSVLNNTKGAATAAVRLEVPRGWSYEPKETSLSFRYEGEEMAVRFFVTPPPRFGEGVFEVAAVATFGGREFREGYQVIAYDHIQARHLFQPAVSTVQTISVALGPGASIGYVRGAGDEVPSAIEQLGAKLTFLTADDLAYGDLSRYSTIVTGIRAYQTRSDLRASNQRLLKYAEEGGHLVVQYNKFEFNQLASTPGDFSGGGGRGDAISPFAPYPAAVTANRITVEEAPVRILVPGHPLLSTPNKITARDFEGWVQERGLYFLGAKDPRYTELLAATDPWPKNPGEKKGMLVEARVGKGTWTYVGLGLWRQLPAGTPGAYRILANLISRARGR